MSRGFFSAGLLAFIALLTAAVAAVVVSAVFIARGQALDHAQERLGAALELTRALSSAGQPPGDELVARVKAATGVDVTLRRPDSTVIASSRMGERDRPGETLEARFETAQLSPIVAVLSLPQRDVLAGHREFVVKLAMLGIAVCALGVLLAWLSMMRVAGKRVAAPIGELRDAVDRVRRGDYSESVAATGDDPIGRLGRALNQMQIEIAERESRIVHHAEYDALTGLTNRTVVADRMRAAFGRAQRRGANVVAMLVDIERFGDINGTLGNDVGDAVLKEVARRLASNTRATDLLARVGGDEFLIVVEDMEEQLVAHISAFLAETLQQPITVQGRNINLRVRIGVAIYPAHCETPDGLRRLSNVALGTAKDSGQSVVLYSPGQDERHLRELAILNDLPTAIDSGQFQLFYQPKIDIKTRNVETVEALVRWDHPQLGRVPPDEFIGLLEQHNQTRLLTDWVIKTAITQARDWTTRGYDVGIAVNLSANDLHDQGLSDRISAMLHHFLVAPSRIAVEVTESAVMRDPEQARAVLQSLREIGLRIAIDDFGTGQTSLALLKQLPLNELKIDKSFVEELRTDSGDAIIVKSTIDLGHNMGLLVVAEGVETTYAWNLLKSYRCDLVQGYLVSKPLPADQFEAWYLRMQARQASRLDFSFLDQQPDPEQEKRDITDALLG